MKILYIILFVPFFLSASNYWSPINKVELSQKNKIIATLDESSLLDLIKEAPLISLNISSTINLAFPTPNNSMIQFEMYESPVMPIDLSKKYPNIKTYTGRGINNPNDRVSVTTNRNGFRILILNNNRRIFINKSDPLKNIYNVSYSENVYDSLYKGN